MEKELWQLEASRLGGESLVQVITDIRDSNLAIIKRLDGMDDRHIATEKAVTALQLAFPAGDTEGHRRYHETQIELLLERRRLRQAITEKTISGLIWSGLVILGGLILQAIRTGVRP